MSEEKLDDIISLISGYVTEYGLKVLGALVVLIVGLWVIKIIVKATAKAIDSKVDDPGLKGFIKSFLSILLKVLLVISVMTILEIEMTSFIAILGAAGLAVGMALSGTLQNFAGGVMVMIFKPFKVGDYIEAMGHSGSVKEIQIFNTILNTPDNRIIIVPNGKIYSESIVNFSKEATRRVDLTFGIGYDDDVEKAKQIIRDIANSYENVLSDPEPFIAIKELGDSSVNIVVRVWVNSANYWPTYFYMTETVFVAFKKSGINIPYPQMDVHLNQLK